MANIGLKLWSTNVGPWLAEARKLYSEGVYAYLELYVVPDSLDTLSYWRKLDMPFIIHNAHFAHGFNLAKKECEARNREIYEQSRKFADDLAAEKIIFHGGVDGAAEETARQLRLLKEDRALLENKPFVALPNRMGGKFCRGATEGELDFIISETGCGFCLDLGHAVCSANSQGIDPYLFIQRLMRLDPYMFHLSDVEDIESPYDSHLHLGEGRLNIRSLKASLGMDALVSIESEKDDPENLNDFKNDVLYLMSV